PGKYSSVHVEFAGGVSNSVAVSSSYDAGLLGEGLLPTGGLQVFTENSDGSANGPENPAPRGTAVVLYATGVYPTPAAVLMGGLLQASIVPDGRFPAQVYRIQATVPADMASGPVSVRLAYRWQPPPSHGNPVPPAYSGFGNSVRTYLR